MVSGFVTSPDDQSRICFDDARPMRMASKSLMSIKVASPLLFFASSSGWSLFDFHVRQLADVAERPDLVFDLLACGLDRRQLDVRKVVELLVGRQRQLAVLVDTLLPLLGLLGC